MKCTTRPTPSLWMASITDDLQSLTDAELAGELAQVRLDLDGAGRFGLVAARALRSHCLGRLHLISDEYLRRAAPRSILPRPIRHARNSLPAAA